MPMYDPEDIDYGDPDWGKKLDKSARFHETERRILDGKSLHVEGLIDVIFELSERIRELEGHD